MYMFVFVYVRSTFLIISLYKGRMRALSSECRGEGADFTNWMTFLPSDLVEEISPNPEALSGNVKVFHQDGIAGKTKMI